MRSQSVDFPFQQPLLAAIAEFRERAAMLALKKIGGAPRPAIDFHWAIGKDAIDTQLHRRPRALNGQVAPRRSCIDVGIMLVVGAQQLARAVTREIFGVCGLPAYR